MKIVKAILLTGISFILTILPQLTIAQYRELTHNMEVIDDEPYLNKTYLNVGIVGLSHLNPLFVDIQMRNYIRNAKWQIDSRFAYGLASLGSNEQGQDILHPKESRVNPTELEVVVTYNFRRIDDTKRRKIYIGSSGSGNNITRYFSKFDVHHISTFGARFGMLHRKNHLEGLRYEAGSFPDIEAMMLGAPVICSQTTSLPETIGDLRFTFDANSPLEIARSIRQVLTNEQFRIQNIENGTQRIQVMLDNPGKVAETVQKLYATLA